MLTGGHKLISHNESFFRCRNNDCEASSAPEVVIIVIRYNKSFSRPMKIGDQVNIVFAH